MIHPTVGRKVWYRPRVAETFMKTAPKTAPDGTEKAMQPLDATIVAVWSDRVVNLVIYDADGHRHFLSSATLLQEGDVPPKDGGYAEWMPYQNSQAKKAEASQ